MKTKHLVYCGILSFLLTSCAPQLVWVKPGAGQTEFQQAKYSCLMNSQQREAKAHGDSVAYDYDNKVVTNDQIFNACMGAQGWRLARVNNPNTAKHEEKHETREQPAPAPKQSLEKSNTLPSKIAPSTNQSSETISLCSIANNKNSYGTACVNNGEVNTADSRAIVNCGKSGGQNCTIVAHFASGCWAVAKDRTLDISGYSFGEPTLEEAKKDAIISCEGHWGKNCEVTQNNGCFNNK